MTYHATLDIARALAILIVGVPLFAMFFLLLVPDSWLGIKPEHKSDSNIKDDF